MKISRIILAAALPLVLSTGCAMDVGTSSEGLTTETDSDFGINACGQTLSNNLGRTEWPMETIVAGDMELSQDDLVEYMDSNPGLRSDLMAEMAAIQLDMAVGFEIPDTVLDGLIAADEMLMAPTSDDGFVPPIVAVDDFDALRRFNRRNLGICFSGDAQTAEVVAGTVDVREGLVEETGSVDDVRANLSTKND